MINHIVEHFRKTVITNVKNIFGKLLKVGSYIFTPNAVFLDFIDLEPPTLIQDRSESRSPPENHPL